MLGIEPQPDIMTLALSRTAPFRYYQSRIGSSTFRLNTILVGLEHVAAGAGQIGFLPVTWAKPVGYSAARQVADQAKTFACSGAIALAADVLDYFLRDIALEEWLGFSKLTIGIATKSVTRKSEDGGAYSLAERAEALCLDLGLEKPIDIAAIELFGKWRNTTVHRRDRSTKISKKSREVLLSNEAKAHFSKNYSNFRIDLAVSNFEANHPPVQKEVSSLVACAQNLSRQIDNAAIRRVASTPTEVENIAITLVTKYFSVDRESLKSGWEEISEAWQGDYQRREKNLLKIFQTVGLTESKAPISAFITPQFIVDLLMLDRDKIANLFQASKAV
jgi:hypothetical protein